MSGKAKIAVVANCQARPVAGLIPFLAPDAEISAVTVVQLAREAEAAEALALYADSDFIFAQAVQDNYPTAFVRTATLKERFGDKVVTWPNIFFRGQCPDIRYMTSAAGRVLGPLGEYQNIVVYEAWQAGLGVGKTIDRLLTGGEWVDRLADEPARSLAELRAREAHLDICVSDYIAAHWQQKRLLHTFNHPTNELLIRVACDLLRHIGMTPSPEAVPASYREALDRFVPALLPPLAERLGLQYGGSTDTKGALVTIADKVAYEQTKIVRYPIAEFAEISFRCLDAQLSPGAAVRIS